MRNCAAFHYNTKLPVRALDEIEKVAPDYCWSYSMGDKALDWRFELGEEVMAWMVIREVYGLQSHAALSARQSSKRSHPSSNALRGNSLHLLHTSSATIPSRVPSADSGKPSPIPG